MVNHMTLGPMRRIANQFFEDPSHFGVTKTVELPGTHRVMYVTRFNFCPFHPEDKQDELTVVHDERRFNGDGLYWCSGGGQWFITLTYRIRIYRTGARLDQPRRSEQELLDFCLNKLPEYIRSW